MTFRQARRSTITLTDKQVAQLQTHVADGRFMSADQIVQRLVSQALDDEIVTHRYSPEVMEDVYQGMAEAKCGQFMSEEETKAFFEDWRRNG